MRMDQAIVERYRDRWVAIQDDGAVVADAEDLDGLLSYLQRVPDVRASIMRIPAADEPLFVGLRSWRRCGGPTTTVTLVNQPFPMGHLCVARLCR